MNFLKTKFYSGQLLVETIIALGVLAILFSAIAPLFAAGLKASKGSSLQDTAQIIAQEGIEAVEALKVEDWNNVYRPLGDASKVGPDFPYNLVINADKWVLAAGGGSPVSLNGESFVRSIYFDNVSRDSSGAIDPVFNPSHLVDPSTQKATVKVSWRNTAFETAVYLTRYQNAGFIQNNWSGSTGENLWQNPPGNMFFSSINTETNVNGKLTLKKTATTTEVGNKFQVSSVAGMGRLTSNLVRDSLRFTAQKTAQVNQVRFYLQESAGSNQTSFRVGLQGDLGGSPSGWLSSVTTPLTGTGWKSVSLATPASIEQGKVYHLVVQYDSGRNLANNRYINLRVSAPLNNIYPKTGEGDLLADALIYDGALWRAQSRQPVYLLRFVDNTFEGNPYDNGASYSVFGANIEGQKFSLTSNITLSGVSAYLAKSNLSNPEDSLWVTIDDLTTPGQLVHEIFQNPTDPTTELSWKTHSFGTSLSLTAGHLYRLTFSSPGSLNTAYQIREISTADTAEYRDLTWDGINSITVRSLDGGTIYSDLGFIDLLYSLSYSVGEAYPATGELISSTFDTESTLGAAFNRIAWQGTGSIKIQLAANTDQATWNFAGPDGTAATFYTVLAGENINLNLSRNANRYLRYKVILEYKNNLVPILDQLRINYAK